MGHTPPVSPRNIQPVEIKVETDLTGDEQRIGAKNCKKQEEQLNYPLQDDLAKIPGSPVLLDSQAASAIHPVPAIQLAPLAVATSTGEVERRAFRASYKRNQGLGAIWSLIQSQPRLQPDQMLADELTKLMSRKQSFQENEIRSELLSILSRVGRKRTSSDICYSTTVIDNIIDCLPSFKKYPEMWDIIAALLPHIKNNREAAKNLISMQKIKTIIASSDVLKIHVIFWQITDELCCHINEHSETLDIAEIISVAETLKAVVYLDTEPYDRVLETIYKHIELNIQNQQFFTKTDIGRIFHSLSGFPNPLESMVDKLLTILWGKFLERQTKNAKWVINILYGLEGKSLTAVVSGILETVYTALLTYQKSKFKLTEIVLMLRGLRTLLAHERAPLIVKILLDSNNPSSDYKVPGLMITLSLLYSLAPYHEKVNIMEQEQSPSFVLNHIDKEFHQVFKQGVLVFPTIVPYLFQQQLKSGLEEEEMELRGAIREDKDIQEEKKLDLHGCTHSLAKVLCGYALKYLKEHAQCKRFIFIVGQSTHNIENEGIMKDIVINLLINYGWKYELFPNNEGRVLIRQTSEEDVVNNGDAISDSEENPLLTGEPIKKRKERDLAE